MHGVSAVAIHTVLVASEVVLLEGSPRNLYKKNLFFLSIWRDGSVVRARTVFAEDPHSIPSTNTGQLLTTCNSAPWDPTPSSGLLWHLHLRAQMQN